MMKTLSVRAQNYVDHFEAALERLPGLKDRNIKALRKSGIERFAARDFPTRKIEEWRYTNLTQFVKMAANTAANEDTAALPALTPQAFDAKWEMVFVDGIFAADQSRLEDLPNGLSISSLASELGNGAVFSLNDEEDRALVTLNTAFMRDGFCLHVSENTQIDDVLAITFRNTASNDGRHIRNRIILDTDAQLTVLERHEGTGTYFVNPVTQVSLADGARLDHYKLQNDSIAACHLAITDVDIAGKAIYKNFTLSVGAKLSRNELKTVILGADAQSHLDGAYLMRGEQHCDTTTLTEHKVPQNISKQTYKGVLDDKAHGVFQGKIHIFKDAQQVAGDQLSKALLLSDFAAVDCKPELEIHADDVKCSHGATTGELDEDALFYLQARGIPYESARLLLIEAFMGDVLEHIDNEQVRSYFSTQAAAWLSGK